MKQYYSIPVVYYPILTAAIKEKNISKSVIADYIGISKEVLSYKLSGKLPFTYHEALTIQVLFFPDIPLDNLFSCLRC